MLLSHIISEHFDKTKKGNQSLEVRCKASSVEELNELSLDDYEVWLVVNNRGTKEISNLLGACGLLEQIVCDAKESLIEQIKGHE